MFQIENHHPDYIGKFLLGKFLHTAVHKNARVYIIYQIDIRTE